MSTEATLQFDAALFESQAECEPLEGGDLTSSEGPSQAIAISSEEELVRHVAAGSREAVSVLFRRHGPAVLNVARRVLRDEAEAADLRQEVFLYIFQRAHQYDPSKSSASSWIIQIAYHRAIDRRRHLNARQHYTNAALEEGEFGIAQQLSTDQLDGRAILERLRGQLSPEQRQTLELHFFEGYSLREIAERSGQSFGNVRHHYYRALERLRANLFAKK